MTNSGVLYTCRMTVWVVQSLLSAQLEEWENLIYVDPRLINRAVAFVLDHQESDGSFRETPALHVALDHKMSYKVL